MSKKKVTLGKSSLLNQGFSTRAIAPDNVKTPRLRVSGHYIDQKLEPLLPIPYQPSLFDLLDSEELKGQIREQGITVKGITLTPSEDKLVNAILFLLKDKSENKDEESKDFYKGNYANSEITNWGGQETKIPHIEISHGELYRAYTGSSDYSGKEILEVNQTQVVQPWMFGHAESKATCLWLKGLPPLKETNNVKDEFLKRDKKDAQRLHYLPPSADRWKIRSTTFQGLADAMAEQWS
jgi:hypothetical protein